MLSRRARLSSRLDAEKNFSKKIQVLETTDVLGYKLKYLDGKRMEETTK